jgi:hypothetical protein
MAPEQAEVESSTRVAISTRSRSCYSTHRPPVAIIAPIDPSSATDLEGEIHRALDVVGPA